MTSLSRGFAASKSCNIVANLLSHLELKNIQQSWKAEKYYTEVEMKIPGAKPYTAAYWNL